MFSFINSIINSSNNIDICECNEIRNGNDLVCPCNCEVLSKNCVYQCACKCNCNCDCPCPCPCECDCASPCVGPTCDSSGKPKTDCNNEITNDGKVVKVSYCNSASTVTNPDGSKTYHPANCGTNNCNSANNPVGDNNSGGGLERNDLATAILYVFTCENITCINHFPINNPPTCTSDCNCNCGSDCACGSSNCGSSAGNGNTIKITGGLQRNCVTFCPVINCDG